MRTAGEELELRLDLLVQEKMMGRSTEICSARRGKRNQNIELNYASAMLRLEEIHATTELGREPLLARARIARADKLLNPPARDQSGTFGRAHACKPNLQGLAGT